MSDDVLGPAPLAPGARWLAPPPGPERQVLNRDYGIVLGLCGHWWQALTVPEVMGMDCPRCGRPPGAFIDCWDETWPGDE